jgi:hypothetical protein
MPSITACTTALGAESDPRLRRHTDHGDTGFDVAGHDGTSANHRAITDRHPGKHNRTRAELHTVTDRDVAGNRHAWSERYEVTDDAVVTDRGIEIHVEMASRDDVRSQHRPTAYDCPGPERYPPTDSRQTMHYRVMRCATEAREALIQAATHFGTTDTYEVPGVEGTHRVDRSQEYLTECLDFGS